MKKQRYFTCLRCAHAITELEQKLLRVTIDCPGCGCKKSFGPNVFVDDFEGYTIEVVMQQKADRRVNS